MTARTFDTWFELGQYHADTRDWPAPLDRLQRYATRVAEGYSPTGSLDDYQDGWDDRRDSQPDRPSWQPDLATIQREGRSIAEVIN